jgi:Flp pilus assembly protein TadG
VIGRRTSEDGTAVVEFVLLAVLIMVPLVYVIAAVATVQRNTLAVTQAARDAGRAFALSDTATEAHRRVAAAVRLALADQGLPDDAQVRFVASGDSCTAAAVTPRLTPGAEFTVCVTRRVILPAVPSVLTGHGIRTIGRYTVHVDDFRAAP